MNRLARLAPLGLSVGLAACGAPTDDDVSQASTEAALAANCAETRGDVPADGWVCGDPQVVECSSPAGTPVATIHVVEDEIPGAGALCTSGDTLEASNMGPYAPGVYQVVVDRMDSAGNRSPVCDSQLTVQDTIAPEVSTQELNLWPPNHKFHAIAPSDCVTATDACDDDLDAVFLWASSDEPAEGRGDGNHEPDIRNLTCEGVELRAERSGNNNGRVYRLGVRVFDDEGNSTDSECVVTVVHDQRGVAAVDDGEDHRVDLPADECGPTGNNPGGNGGGGSGSGGGGGGTGTGGTPDNPNGGTTTGGEGPELPPGGL